MLMLNHAAHVNKKRVDLAVEEGRKDGSFTDEMSGAVKGDPVVWNGKRFSEMNSDEMAMYLRSGG